MRVLQDGRLLLLFLFCFFFFVSPISSLPAGQSVSHSFIYSVTPFLRIYPLSFIHSFTHSFIHLHSCFACLHSSHILYNTNPSGKMSLILIALLQLSLLYRNVISTCSTTSDVEFTFYGFPDGPSDTTSFGCSGTTQVADGTAGGSFKPFPLPPSPTESFTFFLLLLLLNLPALINPSRRRLLREPRNLRHSFKQPQLHPLRNHLHPPLPEVLSVHGPLPRMHGPLPHHHPHRPLDRLRCQWRPESDRLRRLLWTENGPDDREGSA